MRVQRNRVHLHAMGALGDENWDCGYNDIDDANKTLDVAVHMRRGDLCVLCRVVYVCPHAASSIAFCVVCAWAFALLHARRHKPHPPRRQRYESTHCICIIMQV
jgi:hypothetical protein